MKKHFIIPATVVALIGLGAYFGHTPIQSNETSSLLLANAEALAEDSEKSGYAYVHPVHTDWYDGCNCTGKGKEQCCD